VPERSIMPIRCHAEHDGSRIVLSKIESSEHAISLRCFFAEHGVGVALAEPGGEHDYRLILVGLSEDEFSKQIAGTHIELID